MAPPRRLDQTLRRVVTRVAVLNLTYFGVEFAMALAIEGDQRQETRYGHSDQVCKTLGCVRAETSFCVTVLKGRSVHTAG